MRKRVSYWLKKKWALEAWAELRSRLKILKPAFFVFVSISWRRRLSKWLSKWTEWADEYWNFLLSTKYFERYLTQLNQNWLCPIQNVRNANSVLISRILLKTFSQFSGLILSYGLKHYQNFWVLKAIFSNRVIQNWYFYTCKARFPFFWKMMFGKM